MIVRGVLPIPPQTTKRYILRLFISLKYVTANVVDIKRGKVAATASSVEKALKQGVVMVDGQRRNNAKAAAAVGEVLAMRLKVDGLAREPIYADVQKEIEKKGFRNQIRVWAIINALRTHGVNLIFKEPQHTSEQHYLRPPSLPPSEPAADNTRSFSR